MISLKRPGNSGRILRFFMLVLLVGGSAFLRPADLLAVTCTATATDAASIQDLIDNAEADAIVCIEPGTYQVNLTLANGVTLHGKELARTILEAGDPASPVLAGATDAVVQNLTLRGAGVGISFTAVTGLTIRNTVFSGMTTGIEAVNSTFTVANAVFYADDTAIIAANSSTITLYNTILSNNIIDVDWADSTNTSNNNLLFGNDTANYPPDDDTSVYADPLFVDVTSDLRDFHLQADSPALDAGDVPDSDTSSTDIGAYGGPEADTTPFPVFGLTVTSTTVDTATFEWNRNKAHDITGYKIYFEVNSSGVPYEGSAAEGNSPISTDLTTGQLTSLGITLTAPTDLIAAPGNETILVSWEAVQGATGYQVAYGATSGSYTTTVDAGDNLMYQINGLTNGEVLYITVSAYAQKTLYLATSAVAGNNESILSAEVSEVLASSVVTGPASNEISEYPEETVFFPDLEDEHNCFIATAAYGSSLEPQVKLLRKFRNHFLLTNSPGRYLISLYYKLSPPAAAFISRHEWLKSSVRAGLYPVIGLARLCLTINPLLVMFACSLIFGIFIIFLVLPRVKKCA